VTYCQLIPETKYAKCGELAIAYQLWGEGAVDLVLAGSFISHIELFWTVPQVKSWNDKLGSFCRVLWFDKAGVGLSDPVPKVRSLEDRSAEIEAVMDAAGLETAVLMGISEGGPAAILFAATRPERVKALVLIGTFSYTPANWDDLDRSPELVADRVREDLGDGYAVTPEQVAKIQVMGRMVRTDWGSGEALRVLLPSVKSSAQLGMLERMSASPGMARATDESLFHIDVRAVLPTISTPTLVIHAIGDPIPIQGGRYIADHVPGARMVEVGGVDHAPFLSDPDHIVAAIEDFLTGSHGSSTQSHRVLRTVVFTDIVASTTRAADMGDERWRATLQRFAEITQDLSGRFGGAVVKGTGDGHLLTFEGPTQAIHCAEALRSDAASVGVEVRIGVHTGECEMIGDDISGMAVHIAARVMSLAAAGEILVSNTVRDLVVGSGIGFEEHGSQELRGVPGRWQLLAVDPNGPRQGSPEANLVSLHTPSAESAMKRTDRAVAKIARRTPWLLRGLARLVPSATSH
jgi:pimeloyl-ACP methyl ester carboxylesterase